MARTRLQTKFKVSYRNPATEEEVQTIRECMKSFEFWAENFAKIVHPSKGLITPKLYDFQKDLIKTLETERFIIALKSRQVGFSTIMALYLAWAALFHKSWVAGVLSRNGSEATQFLQRVRLSIESCPPFMIPRPEAWSRREILLSTGSQILASPSSKSAFRGESLNFLFIDEAAHAREVEDFYTAATPALSRSLVPPDPNKRIGPSGIVIASTPNGVSGEGKWFYDMWVKSESGGERFKTVKVHWSLVPELDEKWLEEQKRALNYDSRKIAQELEMSFVGSGATVVEGTALEKIKPVDTYTELHDLPGVRVLFSTPEEVREVQENRSLLLGVDVSTGLGRDYSAIQGIDLLTGIQVLEWRGRVKRSDLVELILKLSLYFDIAMVSVERNNTGIEVVRDLLDWRTYDRLNREWGLEEGNQLEKIPVYHDEDGQPGFITTLRSKPILISTLKSLIEEDPTMIRGELTYLELSSFIMTKSGKVSAESGNTDDLVMALAIALRSREIYALYNKMVLRPRKRNRWTVFGSTQPPSVFRQSTYSYAGKVVFENDKKSVSSSLTTGNEVLNISPEELGDFDEEEFLERDPRLMTTEEYSIWKLLKARREMKKLTA